MGGDKPLAYLQKPLESNPFLGWRGIRFCLDNVELFKTQLRAILRVSSSHRIKIIVSHDCNFSRTPKKQKRY